jgi:hypothetical protein
MNNYQFSYEYKEYICTEYLLLLIILLSIPTWANSNVLPLTARPV